MSFWNRLPKGFLALAPMEDVTDTVFRQMVVKMGRPDVMFTEFVNVDAIVHATRNLQITSSDRHRRFPAGEFAKIPALQRLVYSEIERPLVAQIWGNKPESFYIAAQVVSQLGFQGIDINMGCPVKKIVKNGCSALIGEYGLVGEIVDATKRGAGEVPVSVKTRIGRKKIVTEEWIGFLLSLQLAAITVHGRTAAEMSLVPAHWDEIGKAAKLPRGETKIIGNGDVDSVQNAKVKIQKYEVDGVMIGRGIFKNLGVFREDGVEYGQEKRFKLLCEHIGLWRQTWGEEKHFGPLKKFVKMYINGFDGAAILREKLMNTKNLDELELACKLLQG